MAMAGEGEGGPSGAVTGELARARAELTAFAHAIDWTEPFVLALLAFHLCVCALAVCLRGRPAAQAALLAAIATCVYAAEALNGYGSAHWREVRAIECARTPAGARAPARTHACARSLECTHTTTPSLPLCHTHTHTHTHADTHTHTH